MRLSSAFETQRRRGVFLAVVAGISVTSVGTLNYFGTRALDRDAHNVEVDARARVAKADPAEVVTFGDPSNVLGDYFRVQQIGATFDEFVVSYSVTNLSGSRCVLIFRHPGGSVDSEIRRTMCR